MTTTSVVAHDGPKIRRCREAAGLDIIQFAKRIGRTPSYVSQFERGHKKHISTVTYMRVRRVLGITDDSLLRSVTS